MSGRVLVTGAGRRVSEALAKRLARDGWSMAIHAHTSRTDADAVAAAIVAAGGDAIVVCADLTDESAIDAMCRTLAGRGDWVGVVNNAASFVSDHIDDIAMDRASLQLRLNLVAPVYLARKLKAALKPGRKGFVINIADQKVLNPNPDFLSYTLSKVGLANATGALAMALAPDIRVNCIAAGLMLRSGEQTAENFARVHDRNLTGIGTRPEDVAEACAFLACAENVTGAVLPVDGGQHFVPSARDVMFEE